MKSRHLVEVSRQLVVLAVERAAGWAAEEVSEQVAERAVELASELVVEEVAEAVPMVEVHENFYLGPTTMEVR